MDECSDGRTDAWMDGWGTDCRVKRFVKIVKIVEKVGLDVIKMGLDVTKMGLDVTKVGLGVTKKAFPAASIVPYSLHLAL